LLSRKTLIRGKVWIASGLFAVFVVVAVVVWFAWPREKSLGDLLFEAGYFEIVPPSTLSGPGTINAVEFRSDGKIALHPTCDVSPELFTGKLQRSQTIDRALRQSLDKKLNISGQIKDMFEAAIGLNRINSVHLKLENTNILLISDEALISARNSLLKGPCEEAVLQNLSAGARVCQTRAVLEADVSYEIKYNDDVSLGDRAQLNSKAAAKLNLAAHQISTDRITGRHLFFGVKLAPNAILADRIPNRSPGATSSCIFAN